MPSVFTRTLDKATIFLFTEKGFAECIYLGTRRSLAALGKARNFAKCCQLGTRRSLNLCRVPRVWHSAKFRPVRPFRSPVCLFVRPVSTFFAECGLTHGKGLPSAREKALGKAGFAGRRKTVCASPSATLGKEVAECFSAFAECL